MVPATKAMRAMRSPIQLGALITAAMLWMPPALAQSAPEPAPSLFDQDAMDEDTLHAISGRQGAVVSASDSEANISDNSVGEGSVTGTLNVGDNAFQNMSGISMVNMNTGNNSAINAAMNVNILINPIVAIPDTGSGGGN